MGKKLSEMAVTELHTYSKILSGTYGQADNMLRYLQKNVVEGTFTENQVSAEKDKLVEIALEQQAKLAEIRKELSKRVKDRLRMRYTDLDLFKVDKAISEYVPVKDEQEEKPKPKLEKS